MKTHHWILPVILAPAILATSGQAQVLGTADQFAVLGGSAVTSTGATVLNGDLGVSPGTAITGFPPGIVNGTVHSADAVALQAQSDANAAFNYLKGEPSIQDLTGIDLGGQTLDAGVRSFSSSAQLTGTLILDGQGNPNAIFDFQIGSTLTTASAAEVILINGAEPQNVYWEVGSSATLGTTTSFFGDIVADQNITLNTGANITGGLFALNGAVTLDDNNVIAAPEPSAGWLLALCGLVFGGHRGLAAWRRRAAGTRVPVRACPVA